MAAISKIKLPNNSTYDLRDSDAYSTANAALSGVNGTLIYDHTYTISAGVATFTAHVWCGGVEVTDDYPATAFSWSYRPDSSISGTPTATSLGTGKTKQVTLSQLGLGGHVIGTFTTS